MHLLIDLVSSFTGTAVILRILARKLAQEGIICFAEKRADIGKVEQTALQCQGLH